MSPLTAFVYRSLGHERTIAAREQATRMFRHRISPREFLLTLERTMVRDVTKACAHIALSRMEALLEVEARL